jgi:hypothetical protein
LLGVEESRRRAAELGRVAAASLVSLGTRAGHLLELFSLSRNPLSFNE